MAHFCKQYPHTTTKSLGPELLIFLRKSKKSSKKTVRIQISLKLHVNNVLTFTVAMDCNDEVSPNEFVAFIINEGKQKNWYNINIHWRPQIALCPFCAFEYKVYGKLDTHEEDTAYILHKTNLTHLSSIGNVNVDPKNTKLSHGERRNQFWKAVNPDFIPALQKMYRKDLALYAFDY